MACVKHEWDEKAGDFVEVKQSYWKFSGIVRCRNCEGEFHKESKVIFAVAKAVVPTGDLPTLVNAFLVAAGLADVFKKKK
jgi:hypothetical protein